MIEKAGDFCADLSANFEGISEDMGSKLDVKDAKNGRFNKQMEFRKRSTKSIAWLMQLLPGYFCYNFPLGKFTHKVYIEYQINVNSELAMSKNFYIIIFIIALFLGFFLLRSKTNPPPNKEVDETLYSQTQISPSNLHNWRLFSPPSGGFKVLIPNIPQHVADKIADPKTQEPTKYDTFIATDETGQGFMISTITSLQKVDDAATEERLKEVVNDMLKRNKNNKLKNMTLTKFRSYPALDFSLINGELLILGKVFAHGKVLYILSVISNEKNYNQKELESFVNSFEIIEN